MHILSAIVLEDIAIHLVYAIALLSVSLLQLMSPLVLLSRQGGPHCYSAMVILTRKTSLEHF